METAIEKRNKGICERYLKGGETAEALAIDSGLSVMSVRVILKNGDALKKGRPKVLRTEAERVISPLHARLGGMLSHHRAFTKGIDRRMAADELGWSMQRLATAEKGLYNLTLTDVQDIARFLGQPIEEVLSGQSKAKHAPSDGANLVVVSSRTEVTSKTIQVDLQGSPPDDTGDEEIYYPERKRK